MKSLSRKLLAAAVLAVLPVTGAMACTVSQWNSGTDTAVDADAKGPADGAARYSGLCALNSTASGNFVGDNSPANDPLYNARFYVYTGANGAPEVFGAYSADDGGGTQLISIIYNSAGSFDFSANGATGSLSGIQANKWYWIEFAYNSTGGTFSADVGGANGFTGSPTMSGAVGANNIESARLGWISGAGAGNLNTDEFESTRGVAIGALLKADANNSASCNAADLSTVAAETVAVLLGQTSGFAAGQPDCTEDGSVNAADMSCSAAIIVSDLLNGTTCGI